MLPLTVEIIDQNGIQWRPAFRNLHFAKTFFGGEDLGMSFILDRDTSIDFPDVAYGNDVVLRNGLKPIFRGEIRQVESDLETVTVKVLGLWVLLDGYSYGGMGKLWCDSRYGKWRQLTAEIDPLTEYCTARYALDNQNRIYIAPRRDEWFGAGIPCTGGWSYLCTYDEINRISFDYDVDLTPYWRIQLRVYSADRLAWEILWEIVNVDQEGVKGVVVPAGRVFAEFRMFYDDLPARYVNETGVVYGRIFNLRLWGEKGPFSRAIETPSVIHVFEDVIKQVWGP